MEASLDLRMAESSAESNVQFILLLVFTLASVLLLRTSDFELVKESTRDTTVFLGISLLATYIYKHHSGHRLRHGHQEGRSVGQLGFLYKVLHSIYATF